MLATDRFSGFLGDGRGTRSPASPATSPPQHPSRVLVVEDSTGRWLAQVVRGEPDRVLLNTAGIDLNSSPHHDRVIENLGTYLLMLVDGEPALTDAELDRRAVEAFDAFWSLAASHKVL